MRCLISCLKPLLCLMIRVKILVQDLGKFYDTDMVYVNNMTKVIPRPAKQAIIEGAYSLIANGSVRIS